MNESLLNHGKPFTGGRSNQLGLAPKAFKELVITKQIRPMFRGVYVDNREPDSRALRAAALHLIKPEGAVFYGTTVAFLLDVNVFPPKDRFNFEPQCIVPHHQGRCRRPFARCREGYLPEADLMELDGLLVTTPMRTTLDMLRSLWRPHALAAADGMAHAGLVGREEVMSHVARMKRYPGIIQARSLAAMIDPLAESPGESWQRLRIIDAGLPTPRSQVEVRDRLGRLICCLDHGYEEARVGIDYDGVEWHGDDVAEDHDEWKRDFLTRVLGWRLSVATHARIFGDDATFEQQIGEWLGIPAQPRRW